MRPARRRGSSTRTGGPGSMPSDGPPRGEWSGRADGERSYSAARARLGIWPGRLGEHASGDIPAALPLDLAHSSQNLTRNRSINRPRTRAPPGPREGCNSVNLSYCHPRNSAPPRVTRSSLQVTAAGQGPPGRLMCCSSRVAPRRVLRENRKVSAKRSRSSRASRWDQVPTWLQALAALLTALVTIAGIWLTGRQGDSASQATTTATATTAGAGTTTSAGISPQGEVAVGITASDIESKKPLKIRYKGVSSPVDLVKDLETQNHEIYVMIRPAGGDEHEWIFSSPANIQDDGSWSTDLETTKNLDQIDERAALIHCLHCSFVTVAPPLEERIRARSEIRTVRL